MLASSAMNAVSRKILTKYTIPRFWQSSARIASRRECNAIRQFSVTNHNRRKKKQTAKTLNVGNIKAETIENTKKDTRKTRKQSDKTETANNSHSGDDLKSQEKKGKAITSKTKTKRSVAKTITLKAIARLRTKKEHFWKINAKASYSLKKDDALITKKNSFNFFGIFGTHFDANHCKLCNTKFGGTSDILEHLASANHVVNIINQFQCRYGIKSYLKYEKLADICDILQLNLKKWNKQCKIELNVENMESYPIHEIKMSKLFKFSDILGYIEITKPMRAIGSKRRMQSQHPTITFIPFSNHFPAFAIKHTQKTLKATPNASIKLKINKQSSDERMTSDAINELLNVVKNDKIETNTPENGNIGNKLFDAIKDPNKFKATKSIVCANYSMKRFEIESITSQKRLLKNVALAKKIMLHKKSITYSNVKYDIYLIFCNIDFFLSALPVVCF